ncbi:MAG: carbon monoxide dehydrogenase, partial [Pseudomonadota bacterium]
FPIPKAANYQKFDQPASRYALVGVFVARFADDYVRVAVTGAGDDGVFRLAEFEAALGENFSESSLEGLGAAQDTMLSDIHGSAAYRAHLVSVMAKRAVAAA